MPDICDLESPCIICESAPREPDSTCCSPDCRRLALVMRRRTVERGLYAGARRALGWARRYRAQAIIDDPRIAIILDGVRGTRAAIAARRMFERMAIGGAS